MAIENVPSLFNEKLDLFAFPEENNNNENENEKNIDVVTPLIKVY